MKTGPTVTTLAALEFTFVSFNLYKELLVIIADRNYSPIEQENGTRGSSKKVCLPLAVNNSLHFATVRTTVFAPPPFRGETVLNCVFIVTTRFSREAGGESGVLRSPSKTLRFLHEFLPPLLHTINP